MKIAKAAFRVRMDGRGGVNYDGPDSKYDQTHRKGPYADNVNYLKKVVYKNQTGNEVLYKELIKISSNCLRHSVFSNEVPFQTSAILASKSLAPFFIGTIANLLKGYLLTFGKGEDTFKKKSPFFISDGIQDEEQLVIREFRSRSGDKDDTSIHVKEQVGEIKYTAFGCIDVSEAAFFSVDPIFDRPALNSDMIPDFNLSLSKCEFKDYEFGEVPEVQFFRRKSSVLPICERGIIFTNKQISIMISYLLDRLISAQIMRANAYAQVNQIDVYFAGRHDPIIYDNNFFDNLPPKTSYNIHRNPQKNNNDSINFSHIDDVISEVMNFDWDVDYIQASPDEVSTNKKVRDEILLRENKKLKQKDEKEKQAKEKKLLKEAKKNQ